jgi:predicted alpha/beta hydrolase family esterase
VSGWIIRALAPWKAMYHGCYKQLPSLKDDVAATKRILDFQNDPCILVAHSYGSSIITQWPAWTRM